MHKSGIISHTVFVLQGYIMVKNMTYLTGEFMWQYVYEGVKGLFIVQTVRSITDEVYTHMHTQLCGTKFLRVTLFLIKLNQTNLKPNLKVNISFLWFLF